MFSAVLDTAELLRQRPTYGKMDRMSRENYRGVGRTIEREKKGVFVCVGEVRRQHECL